MKSKILPLLTIIMVAGLLPACQSHNGGGIPGGDPASVVEYTITFNYCTGKTSDIVRKTGKTGDQISVPAGKNNGGKIFGGWSTEYDSTN